MRTFYTRVWNTGNLEYGTGIIEAIEVEQSGVTELDANGLLVLDVRRTVRELLSTGDEWREHQL